MATRQFYPVHVPALSGEDYLPIDGGVLPSSIFEQAAHRWAAAGTARHLRVKLDDPPGSGQTRTVQVLVDSGAGAVAALSITLEEGETEATDTGSVAIPEGAFVCIFYTHVGNPPTTRARITVTVDYDDDGVTCYGGGGGIGNGGHNIGAFSSASWSNVGAVFSRSLAPEAGKIDRLKLDASIVVPAGETLDITYSINGVDTGVTSTITEGLDTLDDDLDIDFSAGDLVLIHATPSWTVSSTFELHFSIRVTGEDGVSFLCSSQTVGLPGANITRYTPPMQGSSDVYSTESPATVVGGLSSFTLRNLYVRVQAQVVSVSAVPFAVRLNGVSTALAAATGALGPFGISQVSDLTDEITVDPTDLLAHQFSTGDRYFQGLLSFSAVVEAFAGDVAEEDGSPADEATNGVIGPLIWVNQTRKQISAGSPGSPDDLGTPDDPYSDIEMQCPVSYYGGWKDPWLLEAGSASRYLSDLLSGEYPASTFRYRLADPGNRLRIQLASDNDKYWTETPIMFRMTSRANRAVLGRAFTAFAGLLIDAQPTGRNEWEITLGDLIARRLNIDHLHLPWRLIRDGFLDELAHVSERLDLDQPEPIIYGVHDRIPGLEGSPANAATTGYQITPVYLGLEDIGGGDQEHIWMVAGHACKSVTIYVDGVERDASDDWDVTMEDRTSSTFGTTRRYTLIRTPAGFPGPGSWWKRRITEGDLVAVGDRQITAAVTGVESTGDGTGTTITDLYQQYKHFLINFVANVGPDSYQSGEWLDCPDWDLGDQIIPVIDEDSFDAATAIGQGRLLDDGLIGAAAIGLRGGDRASASQWIAEWNRSSWCQIGQTHPYQLGIVTLHPTQAAKDAAVNYSDNYEILDQSFGTTVQWDRHATHVPWQNDYEHRTGLWKTSGVEETPEVGNYPAHHTPVRSYRFAPGSIQGAHLASLEARFIAEPPRMIRFRAHVGPDPVLQDSIAYRNLGDYITYIHYDAVSEEREIRLAQVQEVSIEGSARQVTMVALDCEALIGYDAGGSP